MPIVRGVGSRIACSLVVAGFCCLKAVASGANGGSVEGASAASRPAASPGTSVNHLVGDVVDPTGRNSLFLQPGAAPAPTTASAAEVAEVQQSPPKVSNEAARRSTTSSVCEEEVGRVRAQMSFRERSSATAYLLGFGDWFHRSPHQLIIGSAIAAVGLACTWDGPGQWRRLTAVASAGLSAGAACREADVWEVDVVSEVLLICGCAAIGASAVWAGFDGSQLLLGASFGAWVSYRAAEPVRSFAVQLPGLLVGWCMLGAALGALALTLWRGRTLAVAAPIAGGFLVVTAMGLLIGRGCATFATESEWCTLLPPPELSWASAAEALLFVAGSASPAAHCACALATLAAHARGARLALQVSALIGWVLATGLVSATGLVCGSLQGQPCPAWLRPESGAREGWLWRLLASLAWAALAAASAWRQLGSAELDNAREAAGYAKLQSDLASLALEKGKGDHDNGESVRILARSGSKSSAVSLFDFGDEVEYFDPKSGEWVPARVLDASPEGSTYCLNLHDQAPADSVRRAQSKQPFQVGVMVGYFSQGRKAWIPAKIVRVHSQGASYDLDCKPDVAPDKIRSRADTYRSGEAVEYYSRAEKRWIPDTILAANDNAAGTYRLRCDDDAPHWRMRHLRGPAAAAALAASEFPEAKRAAGSFPTAEMGNSAFATLPTAASFSVQAGP